ncbi:hypothetical protein [Micromonospora yangpuensis]|uniref:hypothetical protein n=1 Tax=Micromonospora yangpuensis TaxID=683228 RepID=UPI001112E748|nr:hypothetical protein [Micromonospora yangpuensis]
MKAQNSPTGPRQVSRLKPTWVALLGVIVVALILIIPIRIFGAGSHEKESCGNAFSTDLTAWQNVPDGDYWERAQQACNSQRITRVASATGVVSVTFFAVMLLDTRRRKSSHKPEKNT